MTIEKITIKVSLFGEGYEDLEINLRLDDLMDLLKIRSKPTGEIDQNGSYPKGLWTYIHGVYDTMKINNLLKKSK